MPSFLSDTLSTKRSRVIAAAAGTVTLAAAVSAAAITIPAGVSAAPAGMAGAYLSVSAGHQAATQVGRGATLSQAQTLNSFDRVRFDLGKQEYQDQVAVAKAAAAKAAAAKAAAARAAAVQAQQQEQQAQQTQTAAQQQPAATTGTTGTTGTTAAATPSGSPQQIAEQMLSQYGWSASQFSCLQPLWEHESGWNIYAENPGSGAYGIPQALPGSQMASAGPDWQSNAATQIKWGLNYIQSRYGSPCGAWDHEEADGWY